MTRTHVTCFFILVFLGSAVMPEGKERKVDWRTGQLRAVTVQGHGSGTRSVIWWSYCIDVGDQLYSVVSKRSPGDLNLEVNGPVRFAAAGNRLYVVDRKGKTVVLRNLKRNANAERCAKSGVP